MRSTERSKVWLFVCVTKSSFIHRVWLSVFYLEYCRFLLYRTESSVKKVEVVDCDFIAVPLSLAVAAIRILYTFTERSVVIPQSASSWFERQTLKTKFLTYEHVHHIKASSVAVQEQHWVMHAFHPIFQLPKQKPPTDKGVNTQQRCFVSLFYPETFSKPLAFT